MQYLKKNLVKSVVMGAAVFTPVQLFAYRALPPLLWLPFFNIIGLIFDIGLLLVNN